MMIHHMGYRLRGQIHRFSGKLCNRMGKVPRRFLEEMLYGIQARGSVRHSEVARSREEKISLKKVIKRLSRILGRRGLAEDRKEVTHFPYLAYARESEMAAGPPQLSTRVKRRFIPWNLKTIPLGLDPFSIVRFPALPPGIDGYFQAAVCLGAQERRGS